MPRNSIELRWSVPFVADFADSSPKGTLVNADRPSSLCTGLDCFDDGDQSVTVGKCRVVDVGPTDGQVEVANEIAEGIAETFRMTGR
jgi:hypothetical protein